MKRPLNIVCIGGGTGLPQLLMGLKLLCREPEGRHQLSLSHITPVVTAFDDGGSSGRLIASYATLPPGDLRNCLIALADERQEPLMIRFFNHRFGEHEHESLAGHSVGNLLLLTLTQIYGGDLRKALLAVRQFLPIQSNILFTTLQPAVLCAQLQDGTIVRGESQIGIREDRAPIQEIFLESRGEGQRVVPPAMEGVLEAIAAADLITLGPGSLFTSVLPHFLVDGMTEALGRSTALKLYICNLMTEPGETDGYRIADHVAQVEQSGIHLDVVIANHSPVSSHFRRAYERERAQLQFHQLTRGLARAFERALESPGDGIGFQNEVKSATRGLEVLSEQLCADTSSLIQVLPSSTGAAPDHIRLHTADLLGESEITDGERVKIVIRHDPMKLARAILSVVADLRS